MIIVNCAQGSEEWHQERAGVITASMFSDARAKLKSGPNKGEPTAKAQDYAFRLAVERISGKPLDGGFETWQMRRGHELEPQARMEHEAQTGLIVTQVGLVKTDDGAFGASADGFIGEDGGSEYKCFLAPEKLRSFHIDNAASEIMDQVQGCMWITGRKWWHVGMYCPALESVGRQLWWQEFKRDDNCAYVREHYKVPASAPPGPQALPDSPTLPASQAKAIGCPEKPHEHPNKRPQGGRTFSLRLP